MIGLVSALQQNAPIVVPIAGNATVSDGEAMRLTALAGAGIARLARWHVAPDIAAGRLVPLLEAFNPGDEEPTHAVYVGQGKHLPQGACLPRFSCRGCPALNE